MASLEGDCLVVFYYLNTFEIWPDKRDGLWWEWPYKRDDLWWEWPYKRETTVHQDVFMQIWQTHLIFYMFLEYSTFELHSGMGLYILISLSLFSVCRQMYFHSKLRSVHYFKDPWHRIIFVLDPYLFPNKRHTVELKLENLLQSYQDSTRQ